MGEKLRNNPLNLDVWVTIEEELVDSGKDDGEEAT